MKESIDNFVCYENAAVRAYVVDSNEAAIKCSEEFHDSKATVVYNVNSHSVLVAFRDGGKIINAGDLAESLWNVRSVRSGRADSCAISPLGREVTKTEFLETIGFVELLEKNPEQAKAKMQFMRKCFRETDVLESIFLSENIALENDVPYTFTKKTTLEQAATEMKPFDGIDIADSAYFVRKVAEWSQDHGYPNASNMMEFVKFMNELMRDAQVYGSTTYDCLENDEGVTEVQISHQDTDFASSIKISENGAVELSNTIYLNESPYCNEVYMAAQKAGWEAAPVEGRLAAMHMHKEHLKMVLSCLMPSGDQNIDIKDPEPPVFDAFFNDVLGVRNYLPSFNCEFDKDGLFFRKGHVRTDTNYVKTLLSIAPVFADDIVHMCRQELNRIEAIKIPLWYQVNWNPIRDLVVDTIKAVIAMAELVRDNPEQIPVPQAKIHTGQDADKIFNEYLNYRDELEHPEIDIEDKDPVVGEE